MAECDVGEQLKNVLEVEKITYARLNLRVEGVKVAAVYLLSNLRVVAWKTMRSQSVAR